MQISPALPRTSMCSDARRFPRATAPALVALLAFFLTACRHPVPPRPSAVTIVPSQHAPGQTVTIPDEVRQYLNKSEFHWKCNQTVHFLLCYEPGSEAERSIKDLEIIAEEDRISVLQMLGVPEYEPRIYSFLVNSRHQLQKLIGFYGDGRSRPLQHVTFYVVDGPRTLAHEMTHEITTNLWGAAETWIEEGVAVYTTEFPILDGDSHAYFASRRLLPLAQLVNPKWESSMYSPDITYTQLGSFTKFLDKKYGMSKIREVWKGGSESIPQVFGKSLAELEQEWLATLSQPPPPSKTLIFRN
jgi:hypothetical protein